MADEYKITWSIEVDAENAVEAAMRAKWLQMRGNWASVFYVQDIGTGVSRRVDLDDILSEAEWEQLRVGAYKDISAEDDE